MQYVQLDQQRLERRLLIEMFYSTGCRVSEIINIKIDVFNVSKSFSFIVVLSIIINEFLFLLNEYE